jgi:hypothetical protein
MNKVFRFLTLATLTVAFTAAVATTTFAQTDEEKIIADKNRLYDQTFIGNVDACKAKATNPDDCNYKTSNKAKRKAAFDAAKEYVKKYEADADGIITFLKKRIEAYDKEMANDELFARFDTSVKAKNYSEVFASGKLILAQQPDLLDVEIVLASIVPANPPVTAFSSESMAYARSVIQKLEAGKTSPKFGAYDYTYDTKDKTLAAMNYYIGFLLSNGKTPVGKDSLTYYAKAMQYKSSPIAMDSDMDKLFGALYLSEWNRLNDERKLEIKNNKDVENEKSLSIEALQKGYADRAIDAYGRSIEKAKKQAIDAKDPKDKDFFSKRVTTYMDIVSKLYGFRFDKEQTAVIPKPELEKYISELIAKPMPDINSTPAPIVEAPPVVVPPTTPTTPTTTVPATTKPGTKPATAPGTKPATTPATTPATKPATTPAKVPAKPAPKKPAKK